MKSQIKAYLGYVLEAKRTERRINKMKAAALLDDLRRMIERKEIKTARI